MTIPYRTAQTLKRTGITIVAVAVLLALVWLLWFLWLGRFVVYTRADGAVLKLNRDTGFAPGEQALAPEKTERIPIYYNEGENAINTSTELTQITGYYIDAGLDSGKKFTAAMADEIKAQLQQLPAGTPVLLDVKSVSGNFFYNSSISDRRGALVDTAAIDDLISFMDNRGLYAIARLPAFVDYYYGLKHLADDLRTPGGYGWTDENNHYWLDPTSQGTLTYLMQIVSELKERGFDEVVFYNFYVPEAEDLVFKEDRTKAIKTAAKTLVDSCTDDKFTLSFVGQDASFPLPEGRARLYLEGVAANAAQSVAEDTGLKNPAVNLVFLTDNHDTRFEVFSVLRPLSGAH